MSRLIFQGHNTFICRNNWLKKGYDFLQNDHNRFTDDNAVVKLGVGKNMVDSIRYWLRSFGLTNELDAIQAEAEFLLAPEGYDPYLEDTASLWLLHYLLVKTGRASIYGLVFNELRKERFEFSKNHLHQFLKRKCEELKGSYNERTIDSDIAVFLRSYLSSSRDKSDIEEESSGLLQDLSLLTSERTVEIVDEKSSSIDWYKIDSQDRNDLPWQVVLYCILTTFSEPDEIKEPGTSVISFRDLETAPNSPGLVFALNEKGLFHKLEEMTEQYPTALIYSTTAGNRTLTVKRDLLDIREILQDYYGQEV